MQRLSTGRLAVIVTAAGIFLGGCRALEPQAAEPLPWRYSAENAGQVVMVNSDLAYAVLETVVESEPGQEVLVKRKGRRVGRLRMTGQTRHPYVIADVVEGSIEVGDAVLLRPKGLEETP